jgi:hypothetical protein
VARCWKAIGVRIASVEQIHETLHASAALAAGVHLVHGVQTRNVLSRLGAIQ